MHENGKFTKENKLEALKEKKPEYITVKRLASTPKVHEGQPH